MAQTFSFDVPFLRCQYTSCKASVCLFTPSMSLALISPSKEVRAAGLRAFRHMFFDEASLVKLLECRVDIFVTRCVHYNAVHVPFTPFPDAKPMYTCTFHL